MSFALLAQSGEYETQAVLEQVQLGDTVNVVYEALGVNASARVVKTEYDVLGDKYKSVTLGRVKQNLASILVGQNRETENAIAQTKSALEIAIANSTDFIKNGTGYMRFIYNSAGDLVEIVSLDNSDISQAQSVWRWNNGGFGHSSTGYNGSYTTAITQNGAIVADFITTGTLNAARVKAGILSDNAGKNSWNLDTGAFTITDGSINITTSSATQDKIVLTYGNYFVSVSPYAIKQVDANTGGANSITLEQGSVALTSNDGTHSGRYSASSFALANATHQVAGNPIDGFTLINRTDLTNYPMWYSQYGWGIVKLHPDDSNNAPSINLYPSRANQDGRTSLDNSALTFRNSSDVVTATYPNSGLPNLTSDVTTTATTRERIYSFPQYTYSNLGVSSSADLQTFLEAFVKKLCSEHPNLSFPVFQGLVRPNSYSMVMLYIYDTSSVDSNGLPSYCEGWYMPLGDNRNFIKFGTNNYVWHMNNFRDAYGFCVASYWSSSVDTSAFKDGVSPAQSGSYYPFIGAKTNGGGAWTIGRLGEDLRFVYVPSSQYGTTSNIALRYKLPYKTVTTSEEYEILTGLTGALKPTHIDGSATTSFTTSYKYSGVSFTIPAGRYFCVTAHAYYSTVSPAAVGISNSSTAVASGSLQIESLADSLGTRARVAWNGYVSAQTTYYVWAKATGSGNLGIGLDGFYFS